MHTKDLAPWQHSHAFHTTNALGERNTRWVVALTAVTMVIEITTGWLFKSMALLADGWHMGSHVLALGLTAAAYALSRRYANDTRFAFGTWKIEILGGFASAILLGGVALFMAFESCQRLFNPLPILFDQAIAVAVLGLVVNVVSAFLLNGKGHDHHHGHAHAHGHHDHGHADLNLRAAYLHVVADALTSVLAIAALVGGKFLGWNWLDAVMGIVGSVIVSVWAWGLLRETSRVLLDREMDAGVVNEIREALESDGDAKLSDLHVWRVGQDHYACAASLVAHDPKTPAEYKARLAVHEEIAHVTLEINRCEEHPAPA
jgi:cation diffusion facilitator family transporter